MKSDFYYELALTMIPNIGPQTVKTLLHYFESAEQIFKVNKHKLLRIPGIGNKTADSLLSAVNFKAVEKEILFIQKNNIQVIFYNNENYPHRLKSCVDAPLLMFFRGNSQLHKKKVIAIVGSRLATDYGHSICKEIVAQFKPFDPLIISGLAFGIDVCAHKEALLNGLQTIGVLGHGLDRVYPATHLSVAQKMELQGGLLTEFCSGNKPDKEHFPSRNRIIAGLCDALIVIEARESGGALITADIANSYNRDVFAFPGRINDLQSVGCNQLIKNNLAQMVTNAKDIMDALGWNTPENKVAIQSKLYVELNKEEQILLAIIAQKPISVDTLMIQSGFSTSAISSNLLQLEMHGLIHFLPGKIIKAVGH